MRLSGARQPHILVGMATALPVVTLVAMPWLFTPGLFVVVSTLAFRFFGDRPRAAADPCK